MAQNNCKLSLKQRRAFLEGHGYSFSRMGKGSHEIWLNGDLKILAHGRTIEAPANISHPGQVPWEITLPDNPANGTWEGIAKLCDWAKKTADEIKAASPHDSKRAAFAGTFNASARRPANDGKGKRKPRHASRYAP